MKHAILIGLALGFAQSALGQAANFNANELYDRGDVVITSVPNVPLSEAAIELRNPIAPQSNFTARTIEDDRVFAAQVVLRKNGCYDGRLDGVLAEGTVYAIKLFEANMGLVPTGDLTPETETALRQNHDRFDICR